MQQINEKLAQVHRYAEKYYSHVKSVLSESERSIMKDLVATCDSLITRITATLRGTAQIDAIAQIYDDIDSQTPIFQHAADIVGNQAYIRRASVGMTTANEAELQNITNHANTAIIAIISMDMRQLIVADTESFSDSQVLKWVAAGAPADLRIFAATLIAQRGLGGDINPKRFDAAKNAALGITEMTKRVPYVVTAIPPLTRPGTKEETIAALKDSDSCDAVIVVERNVGSTMRSDFDALLTQGKHTPNSGLNTFILRKYRTVIPGSTRVIGGAANADATISSEAGRARSCEDGACHVIETNDGVTYVAWNDGYPIDSEHIAQLTGFADRAIAYHQIMEPTIIDRMFDPSADAIAQRYASDNTNVSGDSALEHAKTALYQRIISEKTPATRSQYMRAALDRDASVQAILKSYPHRPQSLRESIERESSAAKFAMIFEKIAPTKAPTDKEFAERTDHQRLVEIALTATVDAAAADAKRTKVFKFSGKNMAEFT